MAARSKSYHGDVCVGPDAGIRPRRRLGGLISPEGAEVRSTQRRVACARYAEACRRRRANASNPPAAMIKPGRPAPTIGPGTGAACTGPKRICRTSVRPTVLEIRTSVMNWAASVVSVKKFCPFPRCQIEHLILAELVEGRDGRGSCRSVRAIEIEHGGVKASACRSKRHVEETQTAIHTPRSWPDHLKA